MSPEVRAALKNLVEAIERDEVAKPSPKPQRDELARAKARARLQKRGLLRTSGTR